MRAVPSPWPPCSSPRVAALVCASPSSAPAIAAASPPLPSALPPTASYTRSGARAHTDGHGRPCHSLMSPRIPPRYNPHRATRGGV